MNNETCKGLSSGTVIYLKATHGWLPSLFRSFLDATSRHFWFELANQKCFPVAPGMPSKMQGG